MFKLTRRVPWFVRFTLGMAGFHVRRQQRPSTPRRLVPANAPVRQADPTRDTSFCMGYGDDYSGSSKYLAEGASMQIPLRARWRSAVY